MMRLPNKVAELKSLATNALTKRSIKRSRHVRSYCNKPPSMNQEFKPAKKSGSSVMKLVSLIGVAGVTTVGGATCYCLYDDNARKLLQTNVPYSSCYMSMVENAMLNVGALPNNNKEQSSIMDEDEPEVVKFKRPADLPASQTTPVPVVAPTPDTSETRELSLEENEEMKQALISIIDANNENIKDTIENLQDNLEKLPSSDSLKSEKDLHTAVEQIDSVIDKFSGARAAVEQSYDSIDKASEALDYKVFSKYMSDITSLSDNVDELSNKVREVTDLKSKIENGEIAVNQEKPDAGASEEELADDLSTLTLNPPLEAPAACESCREDVDDAPPSSVPPTSASPPTSDDDNQNNNNVDGDEQIDRSVHYTQAYLDEVKLNAEIDRQVYEREAEARLLHVQKQLTRECTEQLKQMDASYKQKQEAKVRETITELTSAHTDCMEERLKRKDEEIAASLSDIIKEERVNERLEMRSHLALWISKMHGIQEGLESRADSEYKGRKSRELWLACQSLLQSVQNGNTSCDGEIGSPKPLSADVKAVLAAGNGHPLVEEVASQFGETSLTEGVSSAAELKHRFNKVYSQSRRVAFVDPAHCSLLRHALSILQSSLILRQPVDISKDSCYNLDTFQLVDSAEYCMQQGDLTQALKFMNQLKGTPREVARDWINDARQYLETKSAVDALISHASASGLSALF